MTYRLVVGPRLTLDTVMYFGIDRDGARIRYPDELGGPADRVPIWSSEQRARAAGAAGVEAVRARDAGAHVPRNGWLIRDPFPGAHPLFAAQRTRTTTPRRLLGIEPEPRRVVVRRLRFARAGRFSPITQWAAGRPVVVAATSRLRPHAVHIVRARDAEDVEEFAALVERRLSDTYNSARVLVTTDDELPPLLAARLAAEGATDPEP